MAQYLRLARPYFVLLALVTIGRWILSFRVPFEVGTDKMSILILTFFACIFYGAFGRRWQRFTLMQAVSMAVVMALASQTVIVLSTLASYLLGLETYFNNPRALQARESVSLGVAMVTRAQGFLGNTVISAVVGMVGWALGALLPSDPA
jgi:hypothetical protein